MMRFLVLLFLECAPHFSSLCVHGDGELRKRGRVRSQDSLSTLGVGILGDLLNSSCNTLFRTSTKLCNRLGFTMSILGGSLSVNAEIPANWSLKPI
jgi:hypothetical protein